MQLPAQFSRCLSAWVSSPRVPINNVSKTGAQRAPRLSSSTPAVCLTCPPSAIIHRHCPPSGRVDRICVLSCLCSGASEMGDHRPLLGDDIIPSLARQPA